MSETQRHAGTPTLNLPNILTLGRMLAVPVIAFACLSLPRESGAVLAFLVFAAASITDYLDGYLARTLDQHTELGRMLDPIADKLLVGVVLLALVANGSISGIHTVAAILILGREIVVSGLREFMSGRTTALRSTQIAKLKTAVQMIALGTLLIAPAIGTVAGLSLSGLGLAILWIATVLTVRSGFDDL
ncbi:MAG: CDP-diacylglycerol--glycerol-3-phosphate 3-phosphatidyltransferase [Pseudomonadota bacterium]